MISKTYELVNRVFHRQFLLRPALEPKPPKVKPSITIARDPGSGGKPIAQLVANKLHFDFYDRQLIESIAKSSRRRKDIISSVDEKTRSAIQDLVHNLFNPEYVSDTTYINHLTKVVLTLAHKGNSVILGRGANFIVPEDSALRVLITAPKNIRIARAIEYEKISPNEAAKRVTKISQQRRQFVSQYFHKRYSNPKHYDLILNTTHYDLDTASDIIISCFRKKFPDFKELVKKTIKKTGRFY